MFGFGKEKLLAAGKKPSNNVGGGAYFQIGVQHAEHQGWIRFFAKNKSNLEAEDGWKFHLSARTLEGQEELARLAVAYGVPLFKCANNALRERFNDPDERQCGKNVVLYYARKGLRGPINWKELLDKAAVILQKHGQGPTVQRDAKVSNHPGIYYRNEKGVKGEKYVAREGITQYLKQHGLPDERAHNLAGLPDVLEELGIVPKTGRRVTPLVPTEEEIAEQAQDFEATQTFMQATGQMRRPSPPPAPEPEEAPVIPVRKYVDLVHRDREKKQAMTPKVLEAGTMAIMVDHCRKRLVDLMPPIRDLRHLRGQSLLITYPEIMTVDPVPKNVQRELTLLLRHAIESDHIPFDEVNHMRLMRADDARHSMSLIFCNRTRGDTIARIDYARYGVAEYVEPGKDTKSIAKARIDTYIHNDTTHRYEIHDVWHRTDKAKIVGSSRCMMLETTPEGNIRKERTPLDINRPSLFEEKTPVQWLKEIMASKTR